jgi:hypothetical protein
MNDKTGDHDVDEITMVRTLLAAPPPPDPRVTANARQRLLQRAAARRPSRRRRWALGLTATAAAAGTAAALMIALPSGGHSGPASDHGGLVTTEERPLGSASGRPAQAFLLAAATRLAQAPVSTGRYWCNQSVSAQLDPIGPGGMELTPSGGGPEQPASPVSDYRYSILDEQESDACQQPGVTGIVGGYLQELGARPATAADAAAWRKGGSPKWLGWYAEGAVIPDQPGTRQANSKRGGPAEPPLPSNPSRAQLRAYLLAIQSPRYDGSLNEDLFIQARTLLLDPISPAVRAADFQVLASIPGVRMQQGVKDPLGRTGTALWIDSDQAMIIVDPATGMLLADEFLVPQPGWVYAPGTVQQYVAWTSTWTNSLPS